MLRLRSMARLASHSGVAATAPSLGLVVMTGDACVLPCKKNRPLPDALKRAWTIVTVLAERLGDDRLAQQHKGAQSGNEDHHQPQQVRRVSDEAAQVYPLFASGWGRSNIMTKGPLTIKSSDRDSTCGKSQQFVVDSAICSWGISRDVGEKSAEQGLRSVIPRRTEIRQAGAPVCRGIAYRSHNPVFNQRGLAACASPAAKVSSWRSRASNLLSNSLRMACSFLSALASSLSCAVNC